MKVEIMLTDAAKEPYAVIYASEITPSIRHVAGLIEGETKGVITGLDNGRIVVLRPDEIYMVRIEDGRSFTRRVSNTTGESGCMSLRRCSEKGL